jgi:hypothetical protein
LRVCGHAEPKRGTEWRGKTFWLLLRRLSKVTRRKGGTLSRRYRKNGYVHNQKILSHSKTKPHAPKPA